MLPFGRLVRERGRQSLRPMFSNWWAWTTNPNDLAQSLEKTLCPQLPLVRSSEEFWFWDSFFQKILGLLETLEEWGCDMVVVDIA